jgi:hypothetical protein
MTNLFRSVFFRLGVTLGLFAIFSSTPWSLARADKGDWTVSAFPVYAYMVIENSQKPKGGGVGAFLQYGITRAFSLRASGLWSIHAMESSDAQGQTQDDERQLGNGALGLAYAFDLLKTTPMLEGGIGVLYQRGKDTSALDMGLYFGLGIDYWLLDWFSMGIAFHYHAFLTDPATYPVYFDAGPRFSLRWKP